jgi:selenocysteine lyase/cysteine desulfurase
MRQQEWDDEALRAAGLDRRTLLRAGAAGGIGLALGGCTSGDSEPAAGSASTSPAATTRGSARPAGALGFDPDDWDSVREQFPLDPDVAQFAAFVLAAHPAPVAAAIERHRDGLDFDTEGYLLKGDLELTARKRAAAYLGVPWREVALTDSTTMGLGVLYGGLELQPGDEVLTTSHDFYSTEESLRLAARRTGASIRRIDLYDDPAKADIEEIVSRVRSGLTDRTRVVAITWVHSSTGVRLPVAEISEVVRDANTHRTAADRVLLCVDGVHGFGLVASTMPELGCDFLSSGTHKWLFGPRGTGLLWGRAWDRVATTIPTFSYPHSAPGPLATPGGYHTFEHRWAVTDAFDFHDAIGPDRIEERTITQASRLKELLAQIPGVTVQTPMSPELSAGIVCVTLDAMPPPEVVLALRTDHRITASVTPYTTQYVRFGPSIATSPDDVQRAAEAVAALA